LFFIASSIPVYWIPFDVRLLTVFCRETLLTPDDKDRRHFVMVIVQPMT